MVKRLRAAWDGVRTSLWLVPSVMVLAGIALAVLLLRVDAGRGLEDRLDAWWLHSGDAANARDLLSTLLSAIITMASLVFLITVVALTLAANQFGSRLIRIFRGDRTTQLTLGLFVGTIIYCVLVLRTIQEDAPDPQVPHISVTVGTALSVFCVLALLAFIQGLARSIVGDEVAKRASRDLHAAIEQLAPLDETGHPEDRGARLPADFEQSAEPVALQAEGYVQAIDYDDIVAWADEADALIRIDVRPGHFVANGDRVVWVDHGARPADTSRVIAAMVVGDERTPTQDLEFAIRHLVELALRALSPGINDVFTAIAVIDRLRGSLTRVMTRRLPSPFMRGRSGKPRVERTVATYDGVLDAAFHQIRQASSKHPAVIIHLLEAIARIAEHARFDEQKHGLARHARLICEAGLRDVPEATDREDIERSFRRAMTAVETKG